MALWPNNRRDIIGQFPVFFTGYLAYQQSVQNTQKRLAYFANSSIASTSSIPEGSFQSTANVVPPIVGGGMSSANNATLIAMTALGNVLNGGTVSGAATLTWDADGVNMSLVVGMSGTAEVTMSCDGIVLALTIGLGGTASWTLTCDSGGLSLLVPASGTGSFTVSGTADLKGLLSLSGESTPFTELSPQSLATAVWNSVAASYNESGTMGEKLNDAGGASNPWTEVIESGYTAAEILRIIAASTAGATSGAGTANMTFKGLDASTNRIEATLDSNGNRTAITVNGG